MKSLIIEDHPIIRKGLKIAIHETAPEVHLFEASSFTEGLVILTENEIDLIILDIDVPGGEGVQMIERIRSIRAEVIILIHSGYDEMVYALPYLRAGANGFLSKRASHEDFLAAWQTVNEKRKYVSPVVQELLLDNIGQGAGNIVKNPIMSLSPSELRVMKLISEGKWNKEIAIIMNLKENTISTYRRRIYDKLNVKDEREMLKKIEIYS